VTSARLALADVRYAALHEERYVFVGARSLDRRLAQPEDASHHTLLDVHPDLPLFRYFLDAAPTSAVWAFSRVEHLGAIAAIRHRVLEGAGVAVLPHYFVREDLRKERMRVLLPRVRLAADYFRLVWRAGNPREPEISALADELRKLPLR
jgi:LysR family transcriptional regulator, glycine cleavage system transcriptional activator